jgi:hypothetical protein
MLSRCQSSVMKVGTSATYGAICRLYYKVAGVTGAAPAIFSVTGKRVCCSSSPPTKQNGEHDQNRTGFLAETVQAMIQPLPCPYTEESRLSQWDV